jgi:hypothetical protein
MKRDNKDSYGIRNVQASGSIQLSSTSTNRYLVKQMPGAIIPYARVNGVICYGEQYIQRRIELPLHFFSLPLHH